MEIKVKLSRKAAALSGKYGGVSTELVALCSSAWKLFRFRLSRLTADEKFSIHLKQIKKFVVISASFLTGCSNSVAPSFTLFGAFFPAWMMCGLIAVLAAIIARVISVSPGWSPFVPFPLLLSVACGLIAGISTWLMFFS